MFARAGPGLSGLISRRFGCCGLFGELDGDGFEFGDELAQAAVGGEVGAEPLGFFGGGGLGGQWQPARWQRVVRLVSEPGRAMPIRASSAWICWCRRARSSMVTGFL